MFPLKTYLKMKDVQTQKKNGERKNINYFINIVFDNKVYTTV